METKLQSAVYGAPTLGESRGRGEFSPTLAHMHMREGLESHGGTRGEGWGYGGEVVGSSGADPVAIGRAGLRKAPRPGRS